MGPRQESVRRAISGSSAVGLAQARLEVGDAGIYLAGDDDRVNDWVVYWVFDNGSSGPPSVPDLIAQLERRLGYFAVLDRHIADVPGQVGNPYWVAGSRPPVERSRVYDRPVSWADLLEALPGTFTRQLDLHEAPWRLTAYTDVRGAPLGSAPGDSDSGRSATVLFAQVSHTILLGQHIEDMARALFGAEPEPFRIDRLGAVVDRPRPIASAVLGAALLPFEYVRWMVRRVGLTVRARRPGTRDGLFTERTATALNLPLGGAVPLLRVIRPDLAPARGRGLTVTNLALAAISLAIQRYLVGIGAACPDDLAALVNVRFDDSLDSPAINKITAVQADLYPTIADPAARARAIQASARDRREVMNAVASAALRVGGAIPYRVVVRRFRRSPAPPAEQRLWVAGVTSVRRIGSTADWALVGRGYAFGGHLFNAAAGIGLGHSLIGGSTDLTVSVVADRDVITDIDEYIRLLAEAFAEVTESLSLSDDSERCR